MLGKFPTCGFCNGGVVVVVVVVVTVVDAFSARAGSILTAEVTSDNEIKSVDNRKNRGMA